MINIKVLKMEDTKQALKMDKVIEQVREAYRSQSAGGVNIFPLITEVFKEEAAEMDIKSGWMKDSDVFGLKVVSWFEENAMKGLPELLGTIMIFDATTGALKGLVDGSYITGIRTGACGALGAKLLARPESKRLLLVGAGNVAFFQAAAMIILFPDLEEVMVYDAVDKKFAENFVSSVDRRLGELGIEGYKAKFSVCEDPREGTANADVIITVTPSREPLIKKEWVKPGTHFSCIGSDMEGKEEIDPEIFRGARVYCDDIAQCLNVGEVEIPVKKGVLKAEDIEGIIGDVITGKAKGRQSSDDITIFDATGIAPLDLLTGLLAIEEAEKLGLGQTIEL